MSKIINFKDIKEKKFKKKYFIYFLFLIILIYIFYSIYLIIKSPNETVVIENGVLNLDESANGYIIREETVLQGENYKNGLTATVSEGERAAKKQIVFRYNSSDEEEIKNKIEETNLKLQDAIKKSETTIFSTDIKNLERQIDEKASNLSYLTDIHSISEYKKEIEENINKKAKIAGELSQSGSYIKELTKQKEKYEKELTNGSEYMSSPVSGVVSYRVDGLEEVLTPNDFSNITEKSLENLELKTGKIVSSSNEKGKIINNFECFIATILNSESAQNAEIGQKVTLTLSSGNDTQAEIKHISKQESGKVLIIFNLKSLTQELIDYRKISFNITWWSISGLKVPNSSIIEDENSNKYIIRRTSTGDEKILVKVLKTNNKFSIIKTFTNEELNSLGLESKENKKISEFDTILLYPDVK